MLFFYLHRCIITLGIFVADSADFFLAYWALTLWTVHPVKDALEAVDMIAGIQCGQRLWLWLLHTDRASLLLFCWVHFSKRLSTLCDLFTNRSTLLPALATLTAAATFIRFTFFANFQFLFACELRCLSCFKFAGFLGRFFWRSNDCIFRNLTDCAFLTRLNLRNRS